MRLRGTRSTGTKIAPVLPAILDVVTLLVVAGVGNVDSPPNEFQNNRLLQFDTLAESKMVCVLPYRIPVGLCE